MVIDLTSGIRSLVISQAYLLFSGAFVFGAGDTTGAGLTTGLGAGVLWIAPVGEEDTAGDGVVLGEFEFSAGSQPTANMIENVATSRIAVRLIKLMLGFFMSLPSFQ